MTCFTPMQAFYSSSVNSKGRRIIVFKEEDGNSAPFYLPCGRCVGCHLERSRQWAIRCMHEAQLHRDNCFITLTYDPKYLPSDGGLVKRHFQLFMKKLRRFAAEKYGVKSIRFFHCGEYGEKNGRPHYHACLFGFDFPDRVLREVVNGIRHYDSQILAGIWGMGRVDVGDVTFESAAYVARYILKKHKGFEGLDGYLDPETGVLRAREYTTMSRRPGIGKHWYDKYASDVYPHDFLYVRGKRMRPPKYYDSLFELDKPDVMDSIRENRSANVVLSEDTTPERLWARQEVKLLEIARLPRNLE